MTAFNRDTEYLALDFDGVIADSIAECLVNGYNAHVRFEGEGDPITRLSDLAPAVVDEARRLRNFIRSGQDYVYIFQAIRQGADLRDQSGFDRFAQAHRDRRDPYFDLFYQVRKHAADSDPAGWAELSPLYPGMGEFLTSFPEDRLTIVTTKKAEYAAIILSHNDVRIGEDRIFQATEAHPKQDILVRLAENRGVAPSVFCFVDDQVDTLFNIRPTGVRCFLAEWGYNNSDQVARAWEHGVSVLSLKAFFDRF